MKYFGFDPPIDIDGEPLGERIPTPIGDHCLWCDETIVEGDTGVAMPLLGESEEDRIAAGVAASAEVKWTWCYYHQECMFRSVAGSAAHQVRVHSSVSGVCDKTCEDNPLLTKRQAAIEALIVGRELGEKRAHEEAVGRALAAVAAPAIAKDDKGDN